MDQPYQKQSRRSKTSVDLGAMVYGKIPPQAREMEEAVLGACMLEKNAFGECSELIDPTSFYVDAHQRIFSAMQTLNSLSRPIDVLTVVEQLREQGDLEAVGGQYYVHKLTGSVVSSANVTTHSRYILQAFIKREVIRIAGELINDGYEDMGDAFELLERAENLILGVRQKTDQSTYKPIAAALVEAFKHLETIRHRTDHLTGVTSGFMELDRVTCGWQETDLIILAARPSVGKTAFALNLATNASKVVPVGFFSLEMSERQLVNRALSAESGILLWNLRNGKMDDDQMKTLYKQGLQPMAARKIFLDDTANIRLSELKAKARRMVLKDKVKIIFIDYLQLITVSEKFGSKNLEVGFISSQLKGLAKDLKVPIICLSQLSRDVEKANQREPKLSDLRDSGSIEQDADMVMFLWRPSDSEIAENIELAQYCNVKIEKHRNGTLERFIGHFIKEIQKWESLKVLDNSGMPMGGNWKPVPEAKSWNND